MLIYELSSNEQSDYSVIKVMEQSCVCLPYYSCLDVVGVIIDNDVTPTIFWCIP